MLPAELLSVSDYLAPLVVGYPVVGVDVGLLGCIRLHELLLLGGAG
jgi:hypothetical protein